MSTSNHIYSVTIHPQKVKIFSSLFNTIFSELSEFCFDTSKNLSSKGYLDIDVSRSKWRRLIDLESRGITLTFEDFGYVIFKTFPVSSISAHS